MTGLLKKDTKYNWTEDCEASFQELKKHLVTDDMSTLHHVFLLLFMLFYCIIKLFGVILMPFLS